MQSSSAEPSKTNNNDKDNTNDGNDEDNDDDDKATAESFFQRICKICWKFSDRNISIQQLPEWKTDHVVNGSKTAIIYYHNN